MVWMKFPPRIAATLAVLSLLAAILPGFSRAESKPKSRVPATSSEQEPAAVSRVKVILEKGWPAVEITSTRPIIPTITKLEDPLRLVIDLPNAHMSVNRKRVDVNSDDIGAVRLTQYPITPPVVRVVVELLKPLSYTWDAAGNRLMIRLHAEEKEATVTPPSVPALTRSPEPVAVPVSPTNSGSLVFAEKLASGASVTAGSDTTALRLARGGEIHICPGTTVSVTRSQNGPDLMVGMSTGAVETHYTLENAADVIQTPDFRILLRGPGEFHYAISADSHGNTCMRGLAGNTGPAIVSELMGDGTYQVEPNDEMVFHSGHINSTDTALHSARASGVVTALPGDCGCPPPPVPTLLASVAATPIDSNQLRSVHLAQPDEAARPIPPGTATGNTDPNSVSTLQVAPGSETAPLPPPKPNEVRVHLEAPIVYSAATPPSSPKPAAIADAQNLPSATSAPPTPPQRAALPPSPPEAAQSKPPHRGFFGKVKGFVSSIFR
jgi:hypothetical protein